MQLFFFITCTYTLRFLTGNYLSFGWARIWIPWALMCVGRSQLYSKYLLSWLLGIYFWFLVKQSGLQWNHSCFPFGLCTFNEAAQHPLVPGLKHVTWGYSNHSFPLLLSQLLFQRQADCNNYRMSSAKHAKSLAYVTPDTRLLRRL